MKGRVRVGFATDNMISLEPLDYIRLTAKGEKRQQIPPPKLSRRRLSGFVNSMQAFVDAVKGRKPTATPGELGREAVALCEAIEKSGQTHRFVKVKQF